MATNSSSSTDSSSKTILKTDLLPIATFWVFIPTNVNWSESEACEIDKENSPSMFVTVPLVVPFSIMVAPGKGILSLSVTIPLTVFFCCKKLSTSDFISFLFHSVFCFLLSSVFVLE